MPAYSGSTPIIWGDLIFLNIATATNSGTLELWADLREHSRTGPRCPDLQLRGTRYGLNNERAQSQEQPNTNA